MLTSTEPNAMFARSEEILKIEEIPEIKKQEEEINKFMQTRGYSRVVGKDHYEIWVPAG